MNLNLVLICGNNKKTKENGIVKKLEDLQKWNVSACFTDVMTRLGVADGTERRDTFLRLFNYFFSLFCRKLDPLFYLPAEKA